MEPTHASAGTTQSQDSETWAQIKAEIRAAYGDDIFTSWFARIDFESASDTTVNLSTPTSFIRHWVQQHYAADVMQRWRAVRPGTREVLFKVRSALRPQPRAPRASGPAAVAPNTVEQTAGVAAPRRQIDAPQSNPNTAGGLEGSALEPRFTFNTFVEGSSNQLAVAAAKKVAFAQPGERAAYNPLFVTGGVGLGKTHLLQAIAGAATAVNPARRTLYLTAEHFMYRFVSAVMNRNTISFKDILRDIDVLLIDDIQFLNGQKVQEEFGHTLTTLVDSQRQVVIAADRAPADLEGLDARVRSRLGGGLLVELTPPDYTMRKAILEQRIKAQQEMFEELVFPDEVIDFVARSITTNGRDLDGAINRLVAHNQLTSAPIDLKMAENALRDLLRARESKKPKIEDIQRVTSQHFNVSRQDLVSARRTKVIVRPRQIAMYLSKTLTPRSLPEIGRRFGNRDHTTVLHAVRKVEELIQKDQQMAEDIETLKRLLDQ
ncbi:chromosomal replication initiator protein DnaA [Acuticoccus yangtzensis]|uniref:chromosomal replication initiator protein DnaA n=1 Tax=Acuticoccus yangtzensis TaxID=1443441 RepID=UPI0009499737|nr:chromosomal replication initiator protein DnaA [Acuticoccus yangtzensis]ORE94434.1 chromosomal replication initiation protein [Stappia sp. 22II-S9-Z10]